MSSLTIGFISAGCIFGGVLLGMLLQRVLPQHHLASDSKDTVKLGAGMLATLTALVLGLLVSSAKGSFDGMNAGIAQAGAKVLLVDHILADYGPETKEVREQLRHIVASVIERIWPEKKAPLEGCTHWSRLMQRRPFKLNCTNSHRKTTCRNRFSRKLRRSAAMCCKPACF